MPSLDKVLAGMALPLDVLREAVVEFIERNPDAAAAGALLLEQIDALRNATDLKQRALDEVADLIAAIQAGHGEVDFDDPHTDA